MQGPSRASFFFHLLLLISQTLSVNLTPFMKLFFFFFLMTFFQGGHFLLETTMGVAVHTTPSTAPTLCLPVPCLHDSPLGQD